MIKKQRTHPFKAWMTCFPSGQVSKKMNEKSKMNTVMAGDIGGTKTRLGLFKSQPGRPVLKTMETYSSQEYKSLEQIIEDFLDRNPVEIESACFGVAGPVINGRCKVTNLPWIISETRIRQRFRFARTKLVNDLAATARAIPVLVSRELYALNKVRLKKGSNIGLVAPGTGLGQALLISRNGEEAIPVSSEGGHVDFAPTHEAEMELWRFLHRQYGHVSVERVISGTGLRNIYSWLKHSGRYKEPAWLRQKLHNLDQARVISETAIMRKTPICVKTMELYVSILGAVSGNLALIALTNGGIYLGGGIPPKIIPILQSGLFMKSFVDKGRFRSILEKVPVRVILNNQAALLGAAKYAAIP
jgi:glucokinase